MLYNPILQNCDMIFSEDSKFFIDGDRSYVRLSAKSSNNLPMQYQTEILNKFIDLLNLSPTASTINLIFPISEILERIEDVDKQEQFVYCLFKTMFITEFCPELDNLKRFNIKDVQYHKKLFITRLQGFPVNFVNTYLSVIYTSIVDSMEQLFNSVPDDAEYFKYAYKMVVVAKEYLDDLIAFSQSKINVGRPRVNKKLFEERPFESAIKIANEMKNK